MEATKTSDGYDAIQWCGFYHKVTGFVFFTGFHVKALVPGGDLTVKKPHDSIRLTPGQWLVKKPNNEFEVRDSI